MFQSQYVRSPAASSPISYSALSANSVLRKALSFSHTDPPPPGFQRSPSPSPLRQRVRINIIPFHLACLCSHTLTHSFARRQMLTLVFLTTFALFAQNTGGGVPPFLHLSLLPRHSLLTTHCSLLLVHCTPPPSSHLFGAKPHA